MKDLKAILDRSRNTEEIISDLMEKSTKPPRWEHLKQVLIPHLHKIVEDKQNRRDRILDGGYKEEAARLYLGLEMLLAKRVNQFSFTIPVKREYSNLDNDDRQEIAKAIERIYQEADIDTVNMARGFAYFASCEIFTLWYAVKKTNTVYGFKSEYKLRCRTFSPINDHVELYPLLDEYDDMICMSVSYRKKIKDEYIEFFETWTDDKHYKWKRAADAGTWEDEIFYEDGEGNRTYGDDIIILKIPGIYGWRKRPVYEEGTPELRQDAEYKHSQASDIISYNAAPLIKAVGKIIGDEKKYESRRLIRMENGGDVSYVTWPQGTDAANVHIQRDIDLFWELNQMPDTSFKNLKSLGAIGYDARQMMLTDAFLKIGEETRPLLQFFRRECNIIKAFLKQMNKKWKEEDIDAVSVKHIINPYIPKDEQYEIQKRLTANGGKPIESQRESISRFGKSPDVETTLKEINEEAQQAQMAQMAAMMGG